MKDSEFYDIQLYWHYLLMNSRTKLQITQLIIWVNDESFYLQVKIQQWQAEGKKIPTPSYLITKLSYKLKPHQTRNQYLTARLDTGTDVNIMPGSVYKLVFNDAELKKPAPSNLDIVTYTTVTVKIVGSCLFYFIHPNAKKLQEVTFYVAKTDGSVLFPALQYLCLDLYNLIQDWIIYLQELAW